MARNVRPGIPGPHTPPYAGRLLLAPPDQLEVLPLSLGVWGGVCAGWSEVGAAGAAGSAAGASGLGDGALGSLGSSGNGVVAGLSRLRLLKNSIFAAATAVLM